MKTLFIAAALGATALTAVAVTAQTAPAQRMRADTNGDGALSRVEFLARAEARFARLDANRDGVLAREERRTAMRGMRAGAMRGRHGAGMPRTGGGARLFAMADADKDGRVSLSEYRSGIATRMQGRPLPDGANAAQRAERQDVRFRRMDANSDGFVDKGEVEAIGARMRERRGGDMPPPPPTGS